MTSARTLVRLPRGVWRRPLAVTGLALAAVLLGAAVVGPLLTGDPIAQDSPRLLAPSAEHWFGTDQLGRDVLDRVVHGARLSLPLALLLVVCSGVLGGVLGAVAGLLGGWVDATLMRAADLVFAFPAIVLAMAVVAALGPELRNAVLAVVVVSWPAYARFVRGLVLGLRESEFLAASRLLGSSAGRALRVEILPNVAGPVAVMAALDVGTAVLLLSGLSFLGLGAQPPAAEWGAMVSDGAQHFGSWWIGVFPGLAILASVLAFNLLGDALRDVLDPRTARELRP